MNTFMKILLGVLVLGLVFQQICIWRLQAQVELLDKGFILLLDKNFPTQQPPQTTPYYYDPNITSEM